MTPIVPLAKEIPKERQVILRGRVVKNPLLSREDKKSTTLPLQSYSPAKKKHFSSQDLGGGTPSAPRRISLRHYRYERLRALTHTLRERLREREQEVRLLTQEKQIKEQELAKTRQELNRAHRDEKRLRTLLKERTGRLERLRGSLRDSQELVEKLQAELQEKEKELGLLKGTNQKLREQVETLRSEMKAAGALIQNLRQSIANLKKEQTASGQEIDRLSERVREKEQQVQELQEKIARLESQLKGEERLREKVTKLREQIDQLAKERDRLAVEVEAEEIKISQLQQELSRWRSGEKKGIPTEEMDVSETRRREIKELLRKSRQTESLPEGKIRKVPVDELKSGDVPKEQPLLTNLPNALSGFVRDANNNPVEGAIVMIKDLANNNLRALRTQEVGQFVVSTPLPNGTYRLVVEKEGLDFDILEVKLDGSVLPPLVIKANT